jgi:hypothetical protein
MVWNDMKEALVFSEFRGANQPAREDSMYMELIHSMAIDSLLSDDVLKDKIKDHGLFLETGGRNGRFELLEIAGLPMNIYLHDPVEGKDSRILLQRKTSSTSRTCSFF